MKPQIESHHTLQSALRCLEKVKHMIPNGGLYNGGLPSYQVKHHLQQIQVPTFILNMPNRHTLNAAEWNLLGWEKFLHLGAQKNNPIINLANHPNLQIPAG